MICHKCQTQFPDMCADCKEVITMQFEEAALEEDRAMFANLKVKKLYVGSGEDCQLEQVSSYVI